VSEPGAADDDPFQRIGHDVADILRAATRAAESSQTRAEAEAAETLAASRTEAAEIVAEAHELREQARRDADEIVHEARARADRLIGRLQSHERDARAHIEAAVGELTQLVAELEGYTAEASTAEVRGPGSRADDAVIDLRDGQPAPSEPTGFVAGTTVEPDDETDGTPDQAGTHDAGDTAEGDEATGEPEETRTLAHDDDPTAEADGRAEADERSTTEPEGDVSAEPSSSADDDEPVERAIRSGVARAVSGFLGGDRRPRPRRDPPDAD
jgi:hypothetical protein